MEVKILKIGEEMPEVVEIKCHQISAEVSEIVAFVKNRQGQLTGISEGMQYEIPIVNLYYVEAVDNRVFLYSAKKTYETKQKLYEIESLLEEKQFLRISKSIIVNLMKIKAIKPALNGRFIAILQNGEEVIISRKYVSTLKDHLKGEKKSCREEN